MKSYDYPDVKSIVFCGDIHGAFNPLVYKLCQQYGIKDTLCIVAGDCGFGFDLPKHYDRVYQGIAGHLRKANNCIAFVRGNHDDPSYFNDEKVSYKRFRTIPDYGVITACGHAILCVGGAVSIDRRERISEQARLGLRKTGYWWPDEAPVFSPEILDTLPLSGIDTVVTHSAPLFCEKTSLIGLAEWAKSDPELMEDIASERKSLDELHGYLKERDVPVRNWYYGHFHESWNSEIGGIKFRMLDVMEFYYDMQSLPA